MGALSSSSEEMEGDGGRCSGGGGESGSSGVSLCSRDSWEGEGDGEEDVGMDEEPGLAEGP